MTDRLPGTTAAPDSNELSTEGATRNPVDFPIVAVGASAGGLEAFSRLLEQLPAEPKLAVVFVQHLSPTNVSLLPELLQVHCKLPVIQVTDGLRVMANQVYVIPPDTSMTLRDGALHLTQRPGGHNQHMPIDTFFTSLSEYAQNRSIGVILSGTANDGAAGIKAIKAVGGIAIAQRPDSAKFDGMPRAAIATESIDLVLSPDEIAEELLRITRHPYLAHRPSPEAAELSVSDGDLSRVFQLLRKATGVDFTYYKPPTIRRRLHQRMVLQKIPRVEHYLTYLQENPAELRNLYQDILIHVTRFFREPESFAALKSIVLPKIVDQRKFDAPIRVWIPGCSTGEEAYSVAITLIEYLNERGVATTVQIFATDLSEAAVDRARSGIYPKDIAPDVSPERLRRFFLESDGGYQISKSIRDLCVFARQDLTRDPPFSKLDLIVCRNVLIYLGAVLQKKLMHVFHYALKRHGFLMLGHAETVGVYADLFAIIDKKYRIYSRKSVEVPLPITFPVEYTGPRASVQKIAGGETPSAATVESEANRVLLGKYTPPGVIVDSTLQIVHFLGATGPFLEPAPGDASLNLLKMAREGLVGGLRSALRAARKGQTPVQRDGLRVKHNGHQIQVDLEVYPLSLPGDDRHFLIVFHGGAPSSESAAAQKKGTAKVGVRSSRREEPGDLARLEQELAASREYLQSVIQDMEAANEELQSANEEILSSNEELQSTNEELDTAKEELQSTNEELNTLNEELHSRNEQLSRVNSDLINLLGSVQIAIVMVSSDLRIRRFTPVAEKLFNLIGGDVGRPVGHIHPNFDCPDLEQLIQEVVDTMTVMEREVSDRDGRRYSLRIRPYKNVENRIDGAVLVLFDAESSGHATKQADEVSSAFGRLLSALIQPALILDRSLNVRIVNDAYSTMFGLSHLQYPAALADFDRGRWNNEEVRSVLERARQEEGAPASVQITQDLPGLGVRTIELSVSWSNDLGRCRPV